MTEQEPCAESRITLSDRRDRFGMPRARITWHKTEKTWGTFVRFSSMLKTEFRRAGLGELELVPPHQCRSTVLAGVPPRHVSPYGRNPNGNIAADRCRG